VVAKAAVLRINLNLEGCGVVAPPMHAPSRAPLLPPPSFTQSPSPPRSLVPVRDGQTSPHVTPHRPLLIVSHSKCPPLSPFPHANSFVICPAVISTHAKGGWQRTRGKWQPGAATLRCSSQAFFLQMGRAKQSGRPGETLASSSKTLSGNSCRFSRFFHFHDGGFRRPRTSGQADRLERLVQSDCAAPQKLRLGRGRRAGAGRDTAPEHHTYAARPFTHKPICAVEEEPNLHRHRNFQGADDAFEEYLCSCGRGHRNKDEDFFYYSYSMILCGGPG
jgi:hypothetical protein